MEGTAESPVLSPPAGELGDLEWFALTWYRQTLVRIIKRKSLLVKRRNRPCSQALADLPGADSGHVVAASEELVDPEFALGEVVVVGGPCIGDCMSYPTLEALYDALQPMFAAQALGAPCVVYLGDEEEAMERGGHKRWTRLAERFETWLKELAAAIGFDALKVVRTGSGGHRLALSEAGSRQTIEPGDLDSAFHLADGPVKPQNDTARQATRRVIEAHLPAVVAHNLGLVAPRPVLVVENLQQAGAFTVARTLAATSGDRVHFAAHWPAPGLSATERMFRSESWDKIEAWELAEVAAGNVPGLHPYSREFFACWLTPELRLKVSEVAREAWARTSAP